MAQQRVDSLRAVFDTVFQARAYEWTPDRDPLAWARRGWAALMLWLRELEQANPTGFKLLVYVAVFALLLIIAHALWVFLRTIRADPAPPTGALTAVAPRHDARWFRQAAHRHAAAGRYREAIDADFQALVLALEERDVLRVHASATPAEHARNLKLPEAARADFAEAVRCLYGYLFARWPCGAAEYASWQVFVDPDRYAPAH